MTLTNDLFSSLFGDPLMAPIKRHMQTCTATVEAVRPFMEAVLTGERNEVEACAVVVATLEQDADSLKREVRQHLPTGLLLSVPRDDLLELVRTQDKVANRARDVAGVMTGRNMQIAVPLHEGFRQCVAAAVNTTTALNDALDKVDALVGSRFSGARAELYNRAMDTVDDCERESDSIEHDLRVAVARIEHQYDPVEVMFLYRSIDLLGEVSDWAQAATNRLRIITTT